MGNNRRFTQEEKEFLRRMIPGNRYEVIADSFNDIHSPPISISQVKSFCCNNKICTGLGGRFEKGMTPWNKGKKVGIYNESHAATLFKKGNTPPQYRPVGSERFDKRDGVTYVKVADPGVWKAKHVIIWEEANGPVPDGKIIISLDGNRQNTEIGNLALIDRATNARMNQKGYRSGDKRITEIGLLNVALEKRIKELDGAGE